MAGNGAGELRIDASRRQMIARAASVGLLMRNSVALIAALVTLVDPASLALPAGKWLLVLSAVWATYRIATRSCHRAYTAIDWVFVLGVCAAIPVLVPDPQFHLVNSAPQAIAGTAVISFAVSVRLPASLLITLTVAATYAWGSAGVVGWHHIAGIAALYYFALQWLTAALIRVMVLRVSSAVDDASAARRAAEIDGEVNDAVHEYEREQLALLHDTAASTLLVVGQGVAPSRERLAAQVQRDLNMLGGTPGAAPPDRMELVSVLRDGAAHLATPVTFDGLHQVWVVGDIGDRVVAAAREIMNNVDRHAHASLLRVSVAPQSVRFVDNGVGFDPGAPRTGHGVTDSILERMRRAGGAATLTSVHGVGTTVELSWRPTSQTRDVVPTSSDTDRFIERIRTRYGLALTAFAVANLAFAVLQAGAAGSVNAGLGILAGLAVAAAIPGILADRWQPAKWAAVALIAVAIVQPVLLPAELVGGYAHWTQSTVGWCVLPLLLALPMRRGAGVLVAYWVLGAIVEFACRPDTAVLVNIGLGTASILSVQLFALKFHDLVREAAVAAQAETGRHQRVIARERVSQALRAEYQRRYARLVDNVTELLRELSESGTVSESLQRRSRVELRRLRALFDQAATFEHPLMQQVRRIVEAAEVSGVDVTVDLAGELPLLTGQDISELLSPLSLMVSNTAATARLVVTGTPDVVSVSLVCDGIDPDAPLVGELEREGRVKIITSGRTVWMMARHALPENATDQIGTPAVHR